VDADLDTLATALYVTTGDLLKTSPHLAPWRPAVGIAPKLSDAELVTLAVMQALLGYPSQARWLRYARAHLRHLFPYLPKQPGYNKRLRAAAALIQQLIRALASDTTFWTDDVWVADSTPWSAAGPPRPSTAPSWPAGLSTATAPATRATFGAAPAPGLHPARPAGRLRLTGAKADEREVLLGILAADPALLAQRPGQTLIADKNYFGGGFEAALAAQGVRLLRPARKGEPERAGAHLFKPLRQVIESINDTFKGQLDLERHGGHTPAGVIVRMLQPPTGSDQPSQAEMQKARDACQQYLQGLQQGFTGQNQTQSRDALLKYAQCMRKNGYDMPDPNFSAQGSSSGGPFGGAIDWNDPTFKKANAVCQSNLAQFGGGGG
jgi:hypothetical protein